MDPTTSAPSHPAALALGLAGPQPRPWKRARFRYLIDSRLFNLLCASKGAAALDRFRASLARHHVAPEGSLPDLEMTPLAVLEALGVDPPRYELPPIPAKWVREEDHMITTVLVRKARESMAEAPELQASLLRKRVEELREKTDPGARELFDLCIGRFAAREKFEDAIYNHLAFDFVYRYRFPEPLREEVFDFLAASLFGTTAESVSGVSKMRIVKTLWERSYERILKRNPGARLEIQALDREMRLWTYRDFLGWEVIHHAILGYGHGTEKRLSPVVAFLPESEETLKARCSAYKSALRAFLDGIKRDELENVLRAPIKAWKPGLLAPCREDGGFDTLVSTGELPVY